MRKTPFYRNLLALGLSLCLSLFITAFAKAEITTISFGIDGVTGPQLIAPLDTTIGQKILDNDQYHLQSSSNSNFKFVRHIFSLEEDICFYWFRSDEDPTLITATEAYSDVYWYVGNAGENWCTFVDGAQSGDNNFVLLRDVAEDKLVGVLQYRLNGSNDQNNPARLLAYAVDPNGLTYADAVAAIEAIPEPSSIALLGLAAAGGIFALRRRQ